MAELKLDQYQDYYPISAERGIVMDFLRGTAVQVSHAELPQIRRWEDAAAAELDAAFLKKLQALPSRRVNATIIPSYMCNLRCTYCYEGSKTGSKQSMTPAYAEAIVNALKTVL
ncbi:MAG: radical SAM/SPASM domain-containing protein, partial [Thermodesulfobacteriota bacterium]